MHMCSGVDNKSVLKITNSQNKTINKIISKQDKISVNCIAPGCVHSIM